MSEVAESKTKLASHTWLPQQVNNQFSQVVRAAALEPQFVTVHGKPTVVILSAETFEATKPVAARSAKTGADMLAAIRGAGPELEFLDEEWDKVFPPRRQIDPPESMSRNGLATGQATNSLPIA
jgi:antitoxin Phd